MIVIKGKKRIEITQRDLAKKVGINEGYLSRIMDGTRTPSLKVAKKLSGVLKLSIEDTLKQLVNRKHGGRWVKSGQAKGNRK